MSRLSPTRPPARPAGRAAGRSAYSLRPEPCLELELHECFYGRSVPLRWRQTRGAVLSEDDDAPELCLGDRFGGRALDPVFFDDVRSVVYHWLAYYSGFGLPEVQAAFRVELRGPPDPLVVVAPCGDGRDAAAILALLREQGASLRPTLH